MSLAYLRLVRPLLPSAAHMGLDLAFKLYSLPTCHTLLSARETRVSCATVRQKVAIGVHSSVLLLLRSGRMPP